MKEQLSDEAQEALEEILSPSQKAVLATMEPHRRRPAPDFGLTTRECAKIIGAGEAAAHRRLEAAVAAGKLDKKVVTCPRKQIIYYPPGTWPE